MTHKQIPNAPVDPPDVEGEKCPACGGEMACCPSCHDWACAACEESDIGELMAVKGGSYRDAPSLMIQHLDTDRQYIGRLWASLQRIRELTLRWHEERPKRNEDKLICAMQRIRERTNVG